MPEWSETNPLRVVTGYHNVARSFFAEKSFEHVVLLSADGALEAAPLMGTADIILDLVSLLHQDACTAPSDDMHESDFKKDICMIFYWQNVFLSSIVDGLAPSAAYKLDKAGL